MISFDTFHTIGFRTIASLRWMFTYGARYFDEQEELKKQSPAYILPYTALTAGTNFFFSFNSKPRKKFKIPFELSSYHAFLKCLDCPLKEIQVRRICGDFHLFREPQHWRI